MAHQPPHVARGRVSHLGTVFALLKRRGCNLKSEVISKRPERIVDRVAQMDTVGCAFLMARGDAPRWPLARTGPGALSRRTRRPSWQRRANEDLRGDSRHIRHARRFGRMLAGNATKPLMARRTHGR